MDLYPKMSFFAGFLLRGLRDRYPQHALTQELDAAYSAYNAARYQCDINAAWLIYTYKESKAELESRAEAIEAARLKLVDCVHRCLRFMWGEVSSEELSRPLFLRGSDGDGQHSPVVLGGFGSG